MEYTKCLVELDEVLSRLSEADLKKIPEDIRNSITESKDKTYIWKYDNTKTLNEQNLDRKTIAMLAYLNMQYLVSKEQKDLLNKMHAYNEMKIENEKKKKYRTEDLFKHNKQKNEHVELVEIKEEKWYQKIFAFFRKKFRRF